VADRNSHRLVMERQVGHPLPPWQRCSRATGNPQHPDYYEPREPHLEDDGWPVDYFSVGGKAARRRQYERRKLGRVRNRREP
jgi:hypothetical protein